MKWIYYFIPIGVHLIFFPFLSVKNIQSDVSLIEMAVGVVIIPIYLIIINIKLTDKISIVNFATKLLLMIGITILGILISYFNWGVISRNLLRPDSATILIIKGEMIVSSIIIIIGWSVAYMIKCRI